MPNEHAVICGDAAGASLRSAKRLALRLAGRDPNVHLRIEDVQSAVRAEPPGPFLDLLELAAYAYAADAACRRGEADDPSYGTGWRRRLHLAVPVRAPGFWARAEARDALADALGFLTEDEYHFHFEPLADPPPFQRYLEFGRVPLEGVVEEVALFSGGLDSLAGAAEGALVRKRRLALVHHRSCTKVEPAVRGLVDALAGRAGSAAPVLFPVRLSKASGMSRERTLRSRSFVYAALAGAVAHALGLSRLRFYENGVVSVNLPLATQVVGSRASRTTHPRALRAFGRLLSLVAGRTFEVENPFQWLTKTDVVRRLADAGCADLIRLSRSCAHPAASSNAVPHCGVCSQCVDRRFAVLAAGRAEDDPASAYAVDLLTGVREPGRDQAMLAVYAETALRLARANQAQFFARYGEAARVLGCLGEAAEVAAARLFDLHKRHGREVERVLAEAVRAHSAAIVARSLPGNCLVRMALGGGAVPDAAPAAPAEPALGDNVFRRKGEAWQVRFAGGPEFVLLPSKGAAYLHLLLQRPERPTGVAELALAVARRPERFALGQSGEVADKEALTAYRVHYQELAEMIARERNAGDVVAVAVLEKQMREMLDAIQKATGLKGRPRKEAGDRDKVRVAVRAAIRRAFADIKKYDRRLAEHLGPPRLACGFHPCYTPPVGVAWET